MAAHEIRSLAVADRAVWREIRLRSLADAPEAFGSKLADWQGPNDQEERWRTRFDDVGGAGGEGHGGVIRSSRPSSAGHHPSTPSEWCSQCAGKTFPPWRCMHDHVSS